MSSDARAWKDGVWWKGSHDGDCTPDAQHESLKLEEVLQSLRACYGDRLYWEFRRNDSGDVWLVAYGYPRA
jgi:hypothetical protein